MAKFRKKPVAIEAMRWDGSEASLKRIAAWANADDGEPWIDWILLGGEIKDVLVHSLEGEMEVRPGDWVIKGVQGEFYPCKPDIFEATYEPAE